MKDFHLKEKSQNLNKCFTCYHLLHVPHKHAAVSKPSVVDMASVTAFASALAFSHTGATIKCL